MNSLTPYIMFNGNCEEAINFYAKAIGGKIAFIQRFGEGAGGMKVPEEQKEKVMHSTLLFKSGRLMASDNIHTDGANLNSSCIHLSLGFEEIEEEKKVFEALSQGGKVTMPLQDTFWGDRFGMLCDKFGIHWMFSCTIKKEKTKEG